MLQKSGGRIFFKSKAALHRAAHIDEQAEFDGQVSLAVEVEDGFHRLVIVENGEISLVQITDELAVTIGGDKEHVDFIDALLDGEDGIVGCVAGGGIHGSGATGSHRNVRSGDDVGSGLGATCNAQAKNDGNR